ncbi:VanZ family protein [Streptomyces pseudogriseolus]|uniref:VanZ family protein n=1 Tax=Streptomyces pseudogriseolus TaxID=36817 RepID=UPI003FA2EFE7
MIHAIFQGHAVFLALAVTVTLLAGVAAYFAVARRAGRARGVFCGLWASSVVGPLTLTTWSGSGVLTGECAINPSVLQAFAGVQGQLNVLLFVPFGVYAVLTSGRPFASLAAGVVLVAAVETSQAVVPFISRLCDSDDLVTNSAGVCAGVMLGVVVRRRMPGIRSAVPSLGRPVTQRALAGGAVVAALVVSAWLTVVHPVRTVLPTPVPAADAGQVQALNAALDEAYLGAYEVEAAEYLDDVDGEGMVTALLPGGFAEILQAERRGGHWRIHWRLSAREGGMRHSAVVDATDGSIHSANSESVPQTTGPRG